MPALVEQNQGMGSGLELQIGRPWVLGIEARRTVAAGRHQPTLATGPATMAGAVAGRQAHQSSGTGCCC